MIHFRNFASSRCVGVVKSYLDRRMKLHKPGQKLDATKAQKYHLPTKFHSAYNTSFYLQQCPRHLFVGATSVMVKVGYKKLVDQTIGPRCSNWFVQVSLWRNPFCVSAFLVHVVEYLLEKNEMKFVDWLLLHILTFARAEDGSPRGTLLLSGRWSASVGGPGGAPSGKQNFFFGIVTFWGHPVF